MKLFRVSGGAAVEDRGQIYDLPDTIWDDLFNRDDLPEVLSDLIAAREPRPGGGGAPPFNNVPLADRELLPPIGGQEVWAAGVTYFRSRVARMEEARDAGGGDFYDRVYAADRPELFFKATAHRVAGHGQPVRIRRDARWSVPEPELTLVITSTGTIVGYTIGNDMSSRDIEGENPLYLPQAKVYDRSCALGPGILVTREPLPSHTSIALQIQRGADTVFEGSTTLASMKRTPAELVEYLYRESSFPRGCLLLTGTGVVPPDAFTLQSRDEIRITIPPIGTLLNVVE
jgi:2-dehydro-3-deoxy-D-arabinonate dehydratase